MPIHRRGFIAGTLLLPSLAHGQSSSESWHVLEARKGALRLVPDPASETPVWGFAGQVPGPLLRIRKGDELRVRLVNQLDQPTALHFQGVRLPNEMDGVAGLTQKAAPPGGSFEYRFTPPDAGTFWYRPSAYPFVAEQKGRGLYGLLIVDEAEPPPVDKEVVVVLDDWRLTDKGDPGPFLTPADVSGEGRVGATLTVNSKPLPEVVTAAPGARVRVRLLNACNARLAGLIFENMRPFIVAIDGQPCDPFEPARKTIPAGPGARFDIVFDMPEGGPDAAISLRAGGLRSETRGEANQKLVSFKAEGAARTQPTPVTAPTRNPALPPVIRLQDAKRHDLTIEAGKSGSDPRKAWTLNGVASSGLDIKPVLSAKRGQPVSLGFINKTAVAHTLHVHGHVMRVLHLLDDGWEPYWRDTVIVPPGRTVRVAFLADNPGRWLIESTILEHAMSGMATVFEVT